MAAGLALSQRRRHPKRPLPQPSLHAGAVQRLVVWAAGGAAVVVADPAVAQAIATACTQAQACAWAGEGPYRLEFRLRSGRAVWLGYNPAGTGYLSTLVPSSLRAWRPSLALHRALAPYLPGSA